MANDNEEEVVKVKKDIDDKTIEINIKFEKFDDKTEIHIPSQEELDEKRAEADRQEIKRLRKINIKLAKGLIYTGTIALACGYALFKKTERQFNENNKKEE